MSGCGCGGFGGNPAGGGGSAELWNETIDLRTIVRNTDASGLGSVDGDFFRTSFQDTPDAFAFFVKTCPSFYAGGTIRVTMLWFAVTADAGNVKWDLAFGRARPGDTTTTVFAAEQTSGAVATAPVAGQFTETFVDFTQAQADGLQPNDAFSLRIKRDTSVAGNLSGAASIAAIQIRELP